MKTRRLGLKVDPITNKLYTRDFYEVDEGAGVKAEQVETTQEVDDDDDEEDDEREEVESIDEEVSTINKSMSFFIIVLHNIYLFLE